MSSSSSGLNCTHHLIEDWFKAASGCLTCRWGREGGWCAGYEAWSELCLFNSGGASLRGCRFPSKTVNFMCIYSFDNALLCERRIQSIKQSKEIITTSASRALFAGSFRSQRSPSCISHSLSRSEEHTSEL